MNDDVILDWLIDKVTIFTDAGKNLKGDMKILNDIRIEYYIELSQTRIEEIKRMRKKK